MKMGSIYSASDKTLYDAINNSLVTPSELRVLFLRHGIVISTKTSRKALAEHYSRLIHDYADFQALAKLFDTGKRRERFSSFTITDGPSLSDYEEAIYEVITELEKTTDKKAILTKQMDGSLKIDFRYKKYHFNKSEFRQVEVKTAAITLEKSESGVLVRGPQNEDVDRICADIIKVVSEKNDVELQIDEISLELIKSPNLRTQFFINLIENLNGHPKHTVTDVYVFKPKLNTTLSLDEDDVSDDSMEVEPDLGIHITKASLKGQGVLESKEFIALLNNPDFYISKIVWQTKPDAIDSDIFEFEAQFSEPETCTRFSYLIRGVYRYLNQEGHSKSRQHLDAQDELELNQIVEESARKSLNLINSGKLE